MSISSHIRKIISICCWSLLGAGAVVLMVAAVNARNHRLCEGYKIHIKGENKGRLFIGREDIIRVLTNNKTIIIKDKSQKSFDLHNIEARLRNEAWIKDAELFFDNNGMLQVSITEREPIARIFTVMGNSYYIDSTGRQLPLSDKMSARLPVFTGFPAEYKKLKKEDKSLIKNIKEVSIYLLKEPFWMAQISQIDITPKREFEMVPTIGNHLIEFGDASDYEKKFNRLMIFYKQVSARMGMEKYERIKVQYDQQVIGVKKEQKKI